MKMLWSKQDYKVEKPEELEKNILSQNWNKLINQKKQAKTELNNI